MNAHMNSLLPVEQCFEGNMFGALYIHILEHRNFHSNTKKNLFTIRVMEPWNRLPREGVESSPLMIFRTCLDAYLCDILLGTCFIRGLGLMVPRGPLKPLQL